MIVKDTELISLEVVQTNPSSNLEQLKPISSQMKEFLKNNISKGEIYSLIA